MEEHIERLLHTEGKTRVYALSDGRVIERTGGSASWRNNNPGNLKFEFAGSADKTVRSHRSKERALQAAQHAYEGVVDLDQWGNAIFETYEAGRAAKLRLLQRKYPDSTVEQMLAGYSRADYSGQTHHRAQAEYIHREAGKRGLDLRGKTIGAMTQEEREALADGIRGFEGWKVGTRRTLAPELIGQDVSARSAEIRAKDGMIDDQVPNLTRGHNGASVRGLQQSLHMLGFTDRDGRPLRVDGDFGVNTESAVRAFQREHGLRVDGVAGKETLRVLALIQANPFAVKGHPQHALYTQALAQVYAAEVARGIAHGRHSENLAGSLTVAAVHAGLQRIDRVEFNREGCLARAVQVNSLRDEPGLNRSTVAVDTHAAIRQPLQASSQQAEEILPRVPTLAPANNQARRAAP